MQAPASKLAVTRTSVGSKPQIAKTDEASWIGPGNIATFVRCLRLLDLDLRDDWPGVRENLFSAKSSQHNLQQRLKCVEWSLYRLFEMWDAAYTKDVRGRLSPWEGCANPDAVIFLETTAIFPSSCSPPIIEPARSFVSRLDRSEEKWGTRKRSNFAKNDAG